MEHDIEFAEPDNTTADVGSVRETDPDLLDIGDDRGDEFIPTDEDGEEAAAPAAVVPAATAADAGSEADPEAEADPDAAAGNKPRMIPHQRFNEVNENLKTERKLREQLEQENERLRQQAAQGAQPPAATAPETPPAAAPEAFDYRAAERRYQQLFLDGDEDGAAAVREEINTALRAEAQHQADQAARTAISQYQATQQQLQQQQAARTEAEQFQQSVAKVYAEHPRLSPESADYDQGLEQDVIDWSNVFVSRGMTRSDALQAAVQKMLPAASSTAPSEAKVKPAPGQLSQEQIQRNLERASQQPPLPTEGTGQRRVIDISKLTDEEFESLPEADRRRARGDSL
ncbi:hypothetical protein SB18R_03315 [Pseudomonas oryzihabitans]|nr:hypothetical protein SB9_12550 [Pseudomonas psychrotolerans]KTT78272.1 hypothetical protein SB18R_03315 [Pseudomonas psychrotolerans]